MDSSGISSSLQKIFTSFFHFLTFVFQFCLLLKPLILALFSSPALRILPNLTSPIPHLSSERKQTKKALFGPYFSFRALLFPCFLLSVLGFIKFWLKT